MHFLNKLVIMACFCTVSTTIFADCFYVKNALNDPIEVQVTYYSREDKQLVKGPLFIISNSTTSEAFPLNQRDFLRGLVDYQLIEVKDNNEKEICKNDLSNQLPNNELNIELSVSENHCDWIIHSLGPLQKRTYCSH